MCKKIVVETDVESFTGKYLYSDMYFEAGKLIKENDSYKIEKKAKAHYHGILNRLVKYPIIGIVAGICRFALSIIHVLGHTLAAIVTQKKGHLYHASKGILEMQRSIVESIPLFGRIFAYTYNYEPGKNDIVNETLHMYESNQDHWWFMKIYNPQNADKIDLHNNLWDGFYNQNYRYIKA